MSLQNRISLNNSPLFLMDGTAFIYRSFYANRHLQRSDGFPTNAIVLTTRLLLRILREEDPAYFLFVMDGKGKNFRHDLYDKYKANRETMPEDLALQIEPIKQIVFGLGLPLHITRNYEADDCIASLAKRYSINMPVIIISGDKDLKQCLSENVFMWDPASKDEKIITMDEFEKETGIPPAQWPDMQALIGDTSDNIPGVPGIGPKTATQIFSEYDNLEDICTHLDRLPIKIQDKLKSHLEEMFLWRKLAKLKTDECKDLTLEDLEVKKINIQVCKQFAKEYEMLAVGKEIITLAAKENNQQTLTDKKFTDDIKSEINSLSHEIKKISDIKQLPPCIHKNVAIIKSEISQIVFAVEQAQPLNYNWTGSNKELCEWLKDANKIIVLSLKPLIRHSESWQKLVAHLGIKHFFDLGLASYLLNPEDEDYSWQRISARWRETLDNANGGLAIFALQIFNATLKNLESLNLLELYQRIEMPLILVLAAMEERGFAIDPQAFQSFLRDVKAETDKLSEDVFHAVGEKFNLRSSRQLGEILFQRLGLTAGKKTKSGRPSTSELALEKLSDNPVVEKVLLFRKFDKMQSTYLDPLPRLMDAHNRIHTTFNQEVTATGRISSSNPNLQNIPVRGPLGARMRACFVASPNCLLIASDYSQIELRILAHLSKDKNLLEAFHQKEDIHARTAALIFDIPPAQITSDQRRMAKTINFGLLYGMGARKLAAELKISEKQATDFIKRYFARLSDLKDFYEIILAGARTQGYVTTMAGRRRWLPGITSANGQIQAQAERQAVNAVIQGSAADIIKIAMIDVANDDFLAKRQAQLVLQVHDELLLETPEDNAEEVCQRVVHLMESVKPGGINLSVPLSVDWGIGKNWAEAH